MVGEIEVIAEPKRKPHQDDSARDKHERRHQENALDEALKDTFPASDPVSFEQPTPTRQGKDLKDMRCRFAMLPSAKSIWLAIKSCIAGAAPQYGTN